MSDTENTIPTEDEALDDQVESTDEDADDEQVAEGETSADKPKRKKRAKKADRPTKLYWIGEYDANGQPLEYFGGVPGEREPIPARDLTPEDTAALTEAQWACIESETGKRLYQRTEPKARQSSTEAGKGSSDTPSPHGDTSAPNAES